MEENKKQSPKEEKKSIPRYLNRKAVELTEEQKLKTAAAIKKFSRFKKWDREDDKEGG